MRMKSAWRYALVGLLIVGLSLGASFLSISKPDAVLVTTLDPNQSKLGFPAQWRVEDIAVCEMGPAASNGEAWGAAVGPGGSEDFRLFHIVGISTNNPQTVIDDDILFLDPLLGGDFPTGMGPRGTPGLGVDPTCQYAYFVNFWLDTVTKVDLSSGEIIWVAWVVGGSVDVQVTEPDGQWVLVASPGADIVAILDAATGDYVAELFMPGAAEVLQGPTSIAVVGKAYAYVLNFHGRNIACIDFTDPAGISVSNVTEGVGTNPFQIVTDTEGRVYVSNSGDDSVSVFAGSGCNLREIAEIAVGKGPRYLALSSDGRRLYVSNALDKNVSVIDTETLTVVGVIELVKPPMIRPAEEQERALPGVLALSPDNRHLLVYGENRRGLIYYYAVGDP